MMGLSAQLVWLRTGASGEPFSSLRPVFFNRAALVIYIMKADQKTTTENEPVGIVISHGWRDDKPSVFSAYIWGQAPEVTPNKGKTAAA